MSVGDYQDVKIKPNSVIYCDIPYRGTEGYGTDFDYERFYDWAERQSELVVISEYGMPSERFEVFSKTIGVTTLGDRKRTDEKLFIVKKK